MIIKRSKDTRQVRGISQKIADIPGGVSVQTAALVQPVLKEGTPIGKGANGLFNVVKTAILLVAALATDATYTVAKGHDLKVGDILCLKEGAKAYTITGIDTTDAAKDVITLGTTLGAAAAIGEYLVEAAAESAGTGSVHKYQATAIVGESYDIVAGENRFVNAWIIAVVYAAIIPIAPAVKAKLTGIYSI